MNRILSRGKVYKGKNLFAVAVVTFLGMILLLRQNAVREALNISINLCLSSIVPAVFPFMILSDFLMANISIKRESRVSRLFSKVTGINACGVLAFILGNICGFPIGAHISTELFENGDIGEDEYKRLLPISTNPSLAFVISGVGMGIRGSFADGIKLYISMVLATIISSIIWKSEMSALNFYDKSNKSEFSLVDSIKGAMNSLIYVFAYIFFFSIVINVIFSFGFSAHITALISTFLEVGNACSNIYLGIFSHSISLAITAFALGFSGISMYVQALSFANKNTKQSMYIRIKLTEGIFALLIAFLLSFI